MPPRFVLAIFFYFYHVTTIHAQCADYTTLLPDPKRVTNDDYSHSLKVDGDYLVVGAHSNDSLEANSGVAYLYKLNDHNQWDKLAELVPSDPYRHAKFGYQLSIKGNTIAVWAEKIEDTGNRFSTIYIYEKPPG